MKTELVSDRARYSTAWIVLVPLTAMFGCSDLPARVQMPDVDPQGIASLAVELYDKDVDGMLSVQELAQTPSLGKSLSRLDRDGDQLLSKAEIEARVEEWIEYRAGQVQTICAVFQKGKPVGKAKVTYQPEEFMLGSVVPAYATTNQGGTAIVSVAKEHRPGPAYKGVQVGFYRIEVTKVDGTKVEGFNDGVEIGGDLQNSHHFDLP